MSISNLKLQDIIFEISDISRNLKDKNSFVCNYIHLGVLFKSLKLVNDQDLQGV